MDSGALAFYWEFLISHSVLSKRLPRSGGWGDCRGGECCLIDAFSPGFLEEPQDSAGSFGSDQLTSEGRVSSLCHGDAFTLRQDHQALFPSISQLFIRIGISPKQETHLCHSPWKICPLLTSVFPSCEMGTLAIPVHFLH